jgi:hypothetical protein
MPLTLRVHIMGLIKMVGWLVGGSLEQGKCKDGSQVAVKRLSAHSTQGKDQFLAEVMTISRVQHRNLVKLRGCCVDGRNRLLVYEYLERKSLRQTLFGNVSFHQLVSLIPCCLPHYFVNWCLLQPF